VALDALVITGVGGGTSVIVRAALPVPLTLIALIVALVVPVDDMVPLISPVAVFTLNPKGNPLAA
jgi:hypothetical protein